MRTTDPGVCPEFVRSLSGACPEFAVVRIRGADPWCGSVVRIRGADPWCGSVGADPWVRIRGAGLRSGGRPFPYAPRRRTQDLLRVLLRAA